MGIGRIHNYNKESDDGIRPMMLVVALRTKRGAVIYIQAASLASIS